MLSQAGRIVLIKSVLLAFPIYYMATCSIPKLAINEITALIRRFLWGKPENTKYMAYIGWLKITKPKGMEGLGIRDLNVVNETLLMKFLFRLASGSQALWAQVVQAKYMPRSDLWLTKRDYKCTPFWRALMRLRDSLAPWLTWRLEDRENCSAFAQPWFEGALNFLPQSSTDREMKVRDLLNEEGNLWDVNRLSDLFGYVKSLEIVQNVQPPITSAGMDVLVFKHSSNGDFSVKKAYGLLTGAAQQLDPQEKKMWDLVWERGTIQPLIRVFIWKLVHNGIPLGSILK